MPIGYQIFMGGSPADNSFYDKVSYVEVEEHADEPGTIRLDIAVARADDGEITLIGDPGFVPLANLALVVTPDGQADECIFDGYVLSQNIHMETGMTASHVEISGQDATWLMQTEEKTREWASVTEGTVANTIFGEYGFTPGDGNTDDDSSAHSDDTHTLMQRATDMDFLRNLARRSGKLFRVSCADQPGVRTGVFAKADVTTDPVATISLNDLTAPNVKALDIEWDVTRPSAVKTRQTLFSDTTTEGVAGDSTDSGLTPLGDLDLASFAGQPVTVMLTTPVDDAGDLKQRADALLCDAGWFVKCTGEVELSALKTVLRAGQVVQLDTIGSVHSGKYLVWSVKHHIDTKAHKMSFTLMRNAVGSPAAASGLPGGL